MHNPLAMTTLGFLRTPSNGKPTLGTTSLGYLGTDAQTGGPTYNYDLRRGIYGRTAYPVYVTSGTLRKPNP